MTPATSPTHLGWMQLPRASGKRNAPAKLRVPCWSVCSQRRYRMAAEYTEKSVMNSSSFRAREKPRKEKAKGSQPLQAGPDYVDTRRGACRGKAQRTANS